MPKKTQSYKFVIEGDSKGLVAASKTAGQAIDGVEKEISGVIKETKQLSNIKPFDNLKDELGSSNIEVDKIKSDFLKIDFNINLASLSIDQMAKRILETRQESTKLKGEFNKIAKAAQSVQPAVDQMTKKILAAHQESTKLKGEFNEVATAAQSVQPAVDQMTKRILAAHQESTKLKGEFNEVATAAKSVQPAVDGISEDMAKTRKETDGVAKSARGAFINFERLTFDAGNFAKETRKFVGNLTKKEVAQRANNATTRVAARTQSTYSRSLTESSRSLTRSTRSTRNVTRANRRSRSSFIAGGAAVKNFSKQLTGNIVANNRVVQQTKKLINSNKLAALSYVSLGLKVLTAAGYLVTFANVAKFIIGSGNQHTQVITAQAVSYQSLSLAIRGYIALAPTLKKISDSFFDYNKTIEGSLVGLAAIVRTFDNAPESIQKFNRSMFTARKIQENLQIAGLKTTATFSELLTGLQEGLGPALRRSFDPRQIVNFVTAMVQAAAGLSLPMDQIGQELRAILDGTIDRSARIAVALQITNKQVKEMASQGKLYDFLMGKLAAFDKAGEQAAKQWEGAFSNLKDAVQSAFGEGFKGTFNEATKFVLRLTDAIVQIDEETATFTFNEEITKFLQDFNEKASAFFREITAADIRNGITELSKLIRDLGNSILSLVKYAKEKLVDLTPLIVPVVARLIDASKNLLMIGGPLYILARAISFLAKTTLGVLVTLTLAFIQFKVTSFFISASIKAMIISTAKIVLVTAAKIAAAFAALYAGYKIGEWITMRKVLKDLAKSTDQFNKSTKELDKTLKRVSKTTGISFKNMDDFEAAEKAGIIFYNKVTEQWEKVIRTRKKAAKSEKQLIKEKKALEKKEKARIKALEKEEKARIKALEKEYTQFLEKIKSIDEQLAQLAEEGAEWQFQFEQVGRSPIEAWKAQREVIRSISSAMSKAKEDGDRFAAAGDITNANKSYARAVELGKKMRNQLKSLAVEVKADFTPAMQSALKAAQEAAEKFGKKYSRAMDDAKNAGDRLKATTDSLSTAQKSFADAQRDVLRNGMTASGVYSDIRAELSELEAASRAAFYAGNYDLAISKAREAINVSSELNREVKEGEKIIVSAEQAKRNAWNAEISARKLEISALNKKAESEKKEQTEALARAQKFGAAKEAEAAKILALESKKAKIVKTQAEATQEASQLELQARKDIVEILNTQREVLLKMAETKKIEANLSRIGTSLSDSVETGVDAALLEVKRLEDALNEAARDRTANIYIKEIAGSASGSIAGAARAATGNIFTGMTWTNVKDGRLNPGAPSMVDSIPVLTAPGEPILKASSFARLGRNLFPPLNRGDEIGVAKQLVKNHPHIREVFTPQIRVAPAIAVAPATARQATGGGQLPGNLVHITVNDYVDGTSYDKYMTPGAWELEQAREQRRQNIRKVVQR